MNTSLILLALVAMGFFCGLRAFTPLALICWVASWGWMPLNDSRLAFLGTTPGATIVTILALGELIGDKLPKTPSRIQAGPLSARAITGALCGSAICLSANQPWLLGVFLGAIGGLAGSFAGYHARRWLTIRARIPDWAVALLEDFVTIAGVLLIFSALFLND
jgi:uncharacterized membrane protein